MSKRIITDREEALKAVQEDYRALEYVSAELKRDKEIIKAAYYNYDEELGYWTRQVDERFYAGTDNYEDLAHSNDPRYPFEKAREILGAPPEWSREYENSIYKILDDYENTLNNKKRK